MASSDPFTVLDEEGRSKLKKAGQADWSAPMLATLTDKRFSDPDWIYERKLDGGRQTASPAVSRAEARQAGQGRRARRAGRLKKPSALAIPRPELPVQADGTMIA